MRDPKQPPALADYLLQHSDEMIAYLARRFGSATVAEEVVRETLVLVRAQSLPPSVANPRAYLLRLATHLGIDRQLRDCAQSALCHQLNARRWDGPAAN